jgi:hypothetical protein
MSLTTTEQLAHMLAADGHRVTYELQVDGAGAPVGERLWHYEGVCPRCAEQRQLKASRLSLSGAEPAAQSQG